MLVNVLRNLRASPQVAALPSMDATTIDIVAMLFDYIFDRRGHSREREGDAGPPADPAC